MQRSTTQVGRAPDSTWHARARAALIHLGASIAVAAIVATMVFVFWYPGPYRSFSGGTELFLLVVSVDLAIGPLIMFVIFDRRKPLAELRRDIGIVIVLQIAALAYGLNMVSISRPVAMALEENRFRVVPASGVYEEELPLAPSEFRSLPLLGPRLVRSTMPSDPIERDKALSLGFRGYDIGTRPSRWQPWDAAARAEALAHAKPLATLAARHPVQKAALDAAVAKTGLAASGLVYIPMITFREDWVALLDAAKGDVVGYAPLDGF